MKISAQTIQKIHAVRISEAPWDFAQISTSPLREAQIFGVRTARRDQKWSCAKSIYIYFGRKRCASRVNYLFPEMCANCASNTFKTATDLWVFTRLHIHMFLI